MRIRRVVKTVLSVEQVEGVGAHVRRSIGRKELMNLDPFLMLDEFKVKKPSGFPDHPHRGFETVTYVLKGVSAHEDFCGHSGLLKPGDLQVGKHLVTLTVQSVGSYSSPDSHQNQTINVLSFFFVQSKIFTRTPTLYLDLKLDGGAKHVQPVPSGWTSFIYTLAGSVCVGPDAEQRKVEPHHTIVFDDGDCIAVENKTSEVCHFVLIAGQPINEPVVQHGPFVMNTEEEINQAVRDYRTGTNGFERATAWRSKIRESF
ncbi:pirin [Oncorhynchus keta]|uniref:pirin n=1 Tax=Oncorhynchus keta TaxID=8018 RepID=UPI00227D4B79|nr:pirin [Oncorhynchus keta]